MCYMYILECSNGQYYVGSTHDLDLRIKQHQAGEGSIFTKKHLPIKLVYYEEFQRIDEAFAREHQVKGWNRQKKEALINNQQDLLPKLSKARKKQNLKNWPFDRLRDLTSTGFGNLQMVYESLNRPFDRLRDLTLTINSVLHQ